ncbi:MAG TPA: GntR family transcriptional regulator [Phototrophicaceae bacterium]|nr:GntR family transcriptional regulator [Phototrophicaceae bacterium]
MPKGVIQPIEDTKKTVAGLVQERIRDAILQGMIPAGERIDQAQLAQDLNVSLVPVREALKKLEGEGFVQIVPRRGAFVTATSVKDMEQLYFARALLEGQAAYHAVNKLKEGDFQALENLMRVMERALDSHDYTEFNTANRAFHFTIYAANHNSYIMNMVGSMWDLAERYRFRYLVLRDQAKIIQDEHQIILDACRRRDAPGLRDAIVAHMNRTFEGIRAHLVANQPTE